MRRPAITLLAALALWLAAAPLGAQQRPAEPPRASIAPGDEIKLDESGALKAVAVQSRMSAILANLALLQRQFQDLQQEWNKSLEERKKLLEDGGRKARVDIRDPNEWVFDEAGQRYVRAKK